MGKRSLALLLCLVLMLSLVACGPAEETAPKAEGIIRDSADVIVVGSGGRNVGSS